jgi:hypothetical protein
VYAEFAQHRIRIARRLYVDEPFRVDLKNTVYALDPTTIDLCLTMFPWAPVRSTKAAIKLHTLSDLHGNIPSFIHISDGKLHDVHVLDELLPELGAFYVMDRCYVDFERLHRLHLAGAFFVTRAKSNLQAKRRYSQAVDRSTGLICDQTITLTRTPPGPPGSNTRCRRWTEYYAGSRTRGCSARAACAAASPGRDSELQPCPLRPLSWDCGRGRAKD